MAVANKGTPMGVAVMGLMRTGTTLVCDLLTVAGKSLVISEPNLHGQWDAPLQEKLHKLYREAGLAIGDPPARGVYSHNVDYFDETVLPQLTTLQFWGVKYVDLVGWRRLFRTYPPQKLILCVRDLRAVAVSALELVNRMGLVFGDRRHLRDEAWVFGRIAHSVHELMAMRQRGHMVLRYEDLVEDPGALERLADYVGLDRLGEDRWNLMIEAGTRSKWEMAKHGKAISKNALDRFDEEPDGPMRSMAERLWRILPEYSLAFGYDVPKPALRVRNHDFRLRIDPDQNAVPYRDVETWNWKGPEPLEPVFGRRRARLLVSRNVKPDAVLLDIGCGTAAMRKLLPAGCSHLPADLVRRSPLFTAADFYGGDAPAANEATHIAALGVLEYAADLPELLRTLRRYNKPVFVSYYARDDTPDLDRAALGWKNGLARNELMRAFIAAGFQPQAKFAFDGKQSLFRLIPKAAMARKPRRPRRKIRSQPGPARGGARKPAPAGKNRKKSKQLEPV
ncbi:MAG: sulfotransferase [Dongiaceae bacterium]